MKKGEPLVNQELAFFVVRDARHILLQNGFFHV